MPIHTPRGLEHRYFVTFHVQLTEDRSYFDWIDISTEKPINTGDAVKAIQDQINGVLRNPDIIRVTVTGWQRFENEGQTLKLALP